MSPTIDQRWQPLDGAHNVRDLGGLPLPGGPATRSGRLLRADALDRLTAADVGLLVDRYGLRHVVDLRSSSERAERGRGALDAAGAVRYTEVEVIPSDALERRRAERSGPLGADVDTDVLMADGYVELLELGAPAFRAAVEALVEQEGTPALFHCSAGKDRTGVLAALLLDLAGVPHEAIVADYALTDERMPAIIERLTGAASFEALAEQVPVFAFRARAATMSHFLTRLADRWGDSAGYLSWAGLPDGALSTAHQLLR